ncbi:MAG: Do family serine endopeptidase [Acidobacteria bacterium]|nr:Do family serine endopeptidase [Acidobacteriota bacterium]
MSRIGYLPLVGVVAVAAFAIGLALASLFSPGAAPSMGSPALVARRSPTLSVPSPGFSFADVAETVNPTVVSITSTRISESADRPAHPQGDSGDQYWHRETPYSMSGRSEDFGSGVIISSDGLILTNNHLVEHSDNIDVKLSDRQPYRARVVGTDALTDLALIKIDSSTLFPAAPLGDSDRLRVGDWVMAIGNPLLYEHTVTVGVVSAKGRGNLATPFDNYIQTDAAINKGNSGGPLINARGEVVGINTLVSMYGQGIGFAIPINTAASILQQLKEKGRVSRGFLGLVPDPVTPEIQASLHLANTSGALVKDVTDNTPAARAGIRRYDVITEINGQPVRDHTDLYRIVAATEPGARVEIKLLRDGKFVGTKVTLEERPPEQSAEAPTPDVNDPQTTPQSLGIEVQDLNAELAAEWHMPSRVPGPVVTWVAPVGPAADAGLQPGDVIVELNRRPVPRTEDFYRISRTLKSGQVVLVLYQRRDDESRSFASFIAAVTVSQ